MRILAVTAATLVAILLGAGAIAFGSPFANDLLFRASLLVILALSWNLMASAGLISLGHSAFWGLGGYASVLGANLLGLPFGVSLVPAILAGAAAGALIALATGRLRGLYFAIATLALSEALRVVAVMLPDVTGGSTGLYAAQAARPSHATLYTSAIVAVCVVVALVYALNLTRLRYAMRAMRNNEDAAQMLGVNPLLYRVLVSTFAGAFAAAAGGLNAWYGGYLSPEVTFTLHYAILAQIATIIGGVYTLAGPIVGALFILGLAEVTRTSLAHAEGFSQLIYGVLLVLFIMFLPSGIYGTLRQRLRSRRRPAQLARGQR